MTQTRVVSSINEGTVIDHVDAGMSLKVIEMLNLAGDAQIIAGIRLESKKMGKKDLIKIEGQILSKEQLDKIALISPKATINLIKDFRVYRKFQVEIPDYFEGIIKCRNPVCISRNENVISKFSTTSREPLRVKCSYCEKAFTHFELL